MTEKNTKYAVIKRFFQREDVFAPNGGQKVTLDELKQLSIEDARELGELAAIELGVELESAKG